MRQRGKYESLYQHLKSSSKETVILSFSEIERLIMRSLPNSANKREWWSNRINSPQSNAWMEAGYKVKELNLALRQVTFSKSAHTRAIRRDGQGFVVWDAELIKALRQHMALTQAQFAEVLGVRQQTVSEWEQSIYAPTRATAKHLLLVAEQAGFSLD